MTRLTAEREAEIRAAGWRQPLEVLAELDETRRQLRICQEGLGTVREIGQHAQKRLDATLGSLHRAVALALCAGGQWEGPHADAIPDAVWDTLHAEGLIKTERDQTGEGYTFTTKEGGAVLLALLAADVTCSPFPGLGSPPATETRQT